MFLVNLVRLLLLVGVLYESGVEAAEHLREQPSDLRETIVSRFDEFIMYSLEHDMDAVVKLIHPDAKMLMDGSQPVVGLEGMRRAVELVTKRAYDIKNTYKVVQPMDEEANYVYVVFHFDFFDESDDNYMNGYGLIIFRKTADGYKFYRAMYNTRNQSTQSLANSSISLRTNAKK